MSTAVPPAPPQGKSEGKARPFVVAAGIFLVVAVAGFLFLRYAAPDTRRSSDRQGATFDAVAKAIGAKKAGAPDDARPLTELQRERLLENVGSISSIQLYQSYLNVGLLADAVRNQSYTKEEAAEILNTILPLLQTVDAQMQKLEDIGLDDDEVAAVKQVRKISGLIRVQADHLKAYWRTGDQASLESFQQARSESWIELRLILGLAAPLPAQSK